MFFFRFKANDTELYIATYSRQGVDSKLNRFYGLMGYENWREKVGDYSLQQIYAWEMKKLAKAGVRILCPSSGIEFFDSFDDGDEATFRAEQRATDGI